jgi:hypothetical protein
MAAVQQIAVLTNNRQTEDVTLEADLYLIVEAQTKIIFQSREANEEGYEVGGSVGGEIDWNAGVPAVVGATGKVKVEVNGKYVKKDIKETINGHEDAILRRVCTPNRI